MSRQSPWALKVAALIKGGNLDAALAQIRVAPTVKDVKDLRLLLAAGNLLAKFKPDLILTDVHMQPMGGLEFVKKLRSASNPMVKNIKVIFMSADASAETIGEALPLGIVGYIVKPPRLEALRAKMEQALGS